MLADVNQAQLDFLETCSLGDEVRVRQMLATGRVQPNFQHKMNGWTALHWAARRGHEEVCLLLLNAGFSRDCVDRDGKTPFDVVLPHRRDLREILRPEDRDITPEASPSKQATTERSDSAEGSIPDTDEMPAEGGSRSPCGSRRGSDSGTDSPKFVASYIRHPPFPYSQKSSSFDNASGGGSARPPAGGECYSYGRRDPLNRTRFLLLRTSCTGGKEAFKRITLPGGSSVQQLKRTVEKAGRAGRCEAVLTLPDRILVEEDSQIEQFGDCQKIEAVFVEETTPPPQSPVTRRSSIPAPKAKAPESPLRKRDTTPMDSASDSLGAVSEEGSLVRIPPAAEEQMPSGESHAEAVPLEGTVGVSAPESVSDVVDTHEEETKQEGAEFRSSEVVPIVEVPVTPAVSDSVKEEKAGEEKQAGNQEKRVSMSVDSENGDQEYVKVSADEAEEGKEKEIVLNRDPSPEPVPPAVEGPLSAPAQPSPPFDEPEEEEPSKQPSVAKVVEEKKVTPGKSDSGVSTFLGHPALLPSLIGGLAIAALLFITLRKKH